MRSVERQVHAPTSVVWDVVGDLPRWAEHLRTIDAITELTSSGPGLGARYDVRQPGLPRAVYEVTDWRPGAGFTWFSTGRGVSTTAGHEIRPTSDGAVLTLTITWDGPLAGIVDRTLGRKTAEYLRREAEDVAALAERAARGDSA